MKQKQIFGIVIAAVIFTLVGVIGVASASSARSASAALLTDLSDDKPMGDSIAVVQIVGTIEGTVYDAFGDPVTGYVHDDVLDLIEEMTYDDTNKGLLLYINSGGGTVYHSDEVYLALKEYKEVTGRPIYAYASETMASGAYYIACAADEIYANRNATVGSIGVYIQTVNYAGLYDKLGIEGEFIRSGSNKAMGNAYDPLTDEQRAIYQSVVDECYEQFIDIVMESRGYSRSEVLPIADGRIYTTAQAVDNGLLDGASDYETVLNDLMDTCGVEEYYIPTFGHSSWLGSLFAAAEEHLPKSEAQAALEFAANMESGVPMYYAG